MLLEKHAPSKNLKMLGIAKVLIFTTDKLISNKVNSLVNPKLRPRVRSEISLKLRSSTRKLVKISLQRLKWKFLNIWSNLPISLKIKQTLSLIET